MDKPNITLPENPTEAQKLVLNSPIDARALILLGMDPTQVDVLKRNKIIPTTVGRFLQIEGIWSDHIRAIITQTTWLEDGIPMMVIYPSHRETFEVDAKNDEIIGWSHYADGSLTRTRYRADSGLTIEQAVVDRQTKQVHMVIYNVVYDKNGRVKEEHQPILVHGDDGRSYQETGKISVDRHIYNGKDWPVEHHVGEFDATSKGKLPAKLDRDMFRHHATFVHNEETGLMETATYYAPPPVGDTVIAFTWDDKGNMLEQRTQGTISCTGRNEYDDEGRVLSLIRVGIPNQTEGEEEEAKEETLYDFSKFWTAPEAF